jgi:hypothetical protein
VPNLLIIIKKFNQQKTVQFLLMFSENEQTNIMNKKTIVGWLLVADVICRQNKTRSRVVLATPQRLGATICVWVDRMYSFIIIVA